MALRRWNSSDAFPHSVFWLSTSILEFYFFSFSPYFEDVLNELFLRTLDARMRCLRSEEISGNSCHFLHVSSLAIHFTCLFIELIIQLKMSLQNHSITTFTLRYANVCIELLQN